MNQNTLEYPIPEEISKTLVAMPKVELHVHLEGFVDFPFWQEMTQAQGSWSPDKAKEMEDHFNFVDFNQFLQCFGAVLHSFKGPDDFHRLTLMALEKLRNQGVQYVEMMMTPSFFLSQGIPFSDLMTAIDQAAKEAEGQGGPKMKLLFDGPRNFGVDVVKQNFALALQDPTGRVIGVGLGGDEAHFPARDFQEPFAWAKAEGLKLTCHAGEAAPESSIGEAIELLGAQRIGHGLGIIAKGPVEELIFKHNIGIDLCPHSNLATGVLPNLESHPLLEYLSRGYSISLNSDDPGFFKTHVLKEYQWAYAHQNIRLDHLCEISQRSVEQSFLEPSEKNRLKMDIRQFQIDLQD